MKCACIDVDFDGDNCTALSDKTVKARKQHRCSCCRSIILPGVEYRRATVAGCGEIWTWRECSICESVGRELFCGAGTEDMWSILRDEIHIRRGDLSQSAIAKLIPDARAKVCDMIEAYWDEEN